MATLGGDLASTRVTKPKVHVEPATMLVNPQLQTI